MARASLADAHQAVLCAAGVLKHTVKSILCDGAQERYSCPHLSRALAALNQLPAPGCSPASSPHEPVRVDLLSLLALISSELEFARDTFQENRLSAAGEAAFVHGLLEHAFEFADRLVGAYIELPQSLDDLRFLASFAGAKEAGIGINTFGSQADTPSPVTAASPLVRGGQRACELLALCSFDIEAAAHAVTALGDQITEPEQIQIASLIRCYGARIAKLNSVLMSYLTGDEVTTLADAQHALYQGAKPLPEGAP
jgi:hypothetical protein